jgi:hypothetical protein
MIEETMGTMTIVFLLVILLFGFDSTGQVKTRRQHNRGQEEAGARRFAQEL